MFAMFSIDSIVGVEESMKRESGRCPRHFLQHFLLRSLTRTRILHLSDHNSTAKFLFPLVKTERLYHPIELFKNLQINAMKKQLAWVNFWILQIHQLFSILKKNAFAHDRKMLFSIKKCHHQIEIIVFFKQKWLTCERISFDSSGGRSARAKTLAPSRDPPRSPRCFVDTVAGYESGVAKCNRH